MGRIRNLFSREYLPFSFMLAVNCGFLILAFIIDKPAEVISGFYRISTSRSILVTDYIAIGGIGATLLNVAIVGISGVFMLNRLGVKPNGPNIMALWMSIGFAFFGKNVFNMLPLTFGVWLFAKYSRASFSKYYLSALLAATLTPTVSEIAFLGMFSRPVEITSGIMMGFAVGFVFPAVSADSLKIHGGFNLYNMGFAGGLVATILATLFRSMGIDIVPANIWSQGNNTFFAVLLYAISFAMILFGIISGLMGIHHHDAAPGHPKVVSSGKNPWDNPWENLKKTFKGFRNIHYHPGRLATDFYVMYDNSIYLNMAILCIFSTTVVLALGAELNGPAMAGILTMTGFGSLGKHIKNVGPVVCGAVISAFVNRWDPAAPLNIVAILFSSGLAPIAGAFGPIWGIVAGFLHVNIAMYISNLNAGLNLYNNGFAAAFVAMFLLPIITIFKRDSYFKTDKYR